MVDRIRVGERGYALIVGEDGRLIAHGQPGREAAHRRADQTQRRGAVELRRGVSQPGRAGPFVFEDYENGRRDAGGRRRRWSSEPAVDRRRRAADEPRRMATARELRGPARSPPSSWRCSALWSSGICGAAAFIQRIFALTRVTRSIAEGKLDTRVDARAGRTRSASSATPSTRWPTGWSSCRKTSGNRNAR